MDRKLIDFIRVLRNAEVRVSTAESIDAMQALALVGYQDRLLLKQALGATLAKSEEEKQSYDYCFDHFFSYQTLETDNTYDSTDPANKNDDTNTDSLDAGDQQGGSADTQGAEGNTGNEAMPTADSGSLDELSKALLAGDSDAIAADIVRAGEDAKLSNIRIFTQKGQYARRILEALHIEALNDNIHQLEQSENIQQQQLAHELKHRRDQLRDQVKSYVEQQYLLFASNAGKRLREDVLKTARLSNLDAHYYRDMQMLIYKMAKKLATQHSRRKRIYKKGQLNAGKTIRRNIANDGILFETHWKFKRKDRPKVIAICDVSGSVSLYARFLLMLLYGLHDVLPNVRAFAFSSHLGEVTDTLKQYPVEKAVELINLEWGMGSTDYGSALEELSTQCLDSVDKHTTVIVLGDGRNNYGEARADLLKALHDRCQRLLWLCPESKSLWGSGDSEMPRYAVYCHDAVECNTLGHLERTISRLLRLTL